MAAAAEAVRSAGCTPVRTAVPAAEAVMTSSTEPVDPRDPGGAGRCSRPEPDASISRPGPAVLAARRRARGRRAAILALLRRPASHRGRRRERLRQVDAVPAARRTDSPHRRDRAALRRPRTVTATRRAPRCSSCCRTRSSVAEPGARRPATILARPLAHGYAGARPGRADHPELLGPGRRSTRPSMFTGNIRISCPAASVSALRSPGRWLSGPRVLLADEPVSMLDVSIRLGVLNLLAACATGRASPSSTSPTTSRPRATWPT